MKPTHIEPPPIIPTREEVEPGTMSWGIFRLLHPKTVEYMLRNVKPEKSPCARE